MPARVYFMKRVKDCLRKLNREDGQVYSVCILQFACTTVCSQNINKQNVNLADETHTDYSFLAVGITILNQRII